MDGSLSLQDCYGWEGLSHPDPLVRIAAIHHAGRRLDGDRVLRWRVLRLMGDRDPRVARYAALTLARAGSAEGRERLLTVLARADGPERAALKGCLLAGPAFPFAALLDELLPLEAVARVEDDYARAVLGGLLFLGPEYLRAATDFLSWLAGLDRAGVVPLREGAYFDQGQVLGGPRPDRPGMLYCEARGLFLPFREEAAINPDELPGGRAAFVARRSDPSGAVRRLFALGGRPQPLAPPAEALAAPAGRGGLVAGVCSGRAEGGGSRVQVLYADGRRYEGDHPPLEPGRLALTEPGSGPPSCLVPEGPALPREAVRAVVGAHAAARRLALAQVVALGPDPAECEVRLEDGRTELIEVPSPRLGLPCWWARARPAGAPAGVRRAPRTEPPAARLR
jgi:hypothetical protein